MVADLDLNLLKVFDALVERNSVTGAAERLHLSVPATSRALGRLRRAMGDPVLVRAGRGLAPTPFALRAAPQVRSLLDGARALLVEERELDLARLERAFVLRINDALTATLAAELITRIREPAPKVTLRFVHEGTEEIEALRDGTVDLDIGVQRRPAPDLRSQQLYVEEFVAVVGAGSELGRDGAPTAAQLCAHPHVSTSRRGRARGPIDDALQREGLHRHVAAVVTSFPLAVQMAADADLVAPVPRRTAAYYAERIAVRWFPIPLELPTLTIAQQWHARLDHDPAQQWLRGEVARAVAG